MHEVQLIYISCGLGQSVGSSLADDEIRLKVSRRRRKSLPSASEVLYRVVSGTSVCSVLKSGATLLLLSAVTHLSQNANIQYKGLKLLEKTILLQVLLL